MRKNKKLKKISKNLIIYTLSHHYIIKINAVKVLFFKLYQIIIL